MSLIATDLTFDFRGRRALDGVSLACERGELLGVVGPNGAGKSTLMRLLAGLERPVRGAVTWDASPIGALRPVERARTLAFLPQSPTVAFGFTARDVALMGRLSHHAGAFETAADREVAEAALAAVGAQDLAGRSMETLSGGERQRVFLAMSLAQDTPGLLLDEPLGHLDVGHQMALCEGLAKRAHAGRAVVLVLHDLNLAAQFCDRLLLLVGGRAVLTGPPRAVLESEVLANAYGVRALVGSHPQRDRPVFTPLRS